MNRPLYVIGTEIKALWGAKLNYGAKPYVDAMCTLTNIEDNYFADSAKSIVLYFLANAATWRGDDAKRVKTELKQMVGLK